MKDLKTMVNSAKSVCENLKLAVYDDTDSWASDYIGYRVVKELCALLKDEVAANVLRENLEKLEKTLRKELIQCGICPECGGGLEMAVDYESDTTYVPYGDTYVSLDDYDTFMECRQCGEVYKDD